MNKVPEFKTLDELVAFWEEHDFADYWSELEEVRPEEAKPGMPHHVSIELPLGTLLDAIDRLPLEDARLVYERLSEKLDAT